MIKPAESAPELFESLVEPHGGADVLSPIDVEIIGTITKLLAALRTADPGDVPKTVARLMAQLPPPKRESAVPTLAEHLARRAAERHRAAQAIGFTKVADNPAGRSQPTSALDGGAIPSEAPA